MARELDSESDRLVAMAEEFGAHNYAPLPVVLSRGEGSWVWDVAGIKYLDCLSAYSAVNFGHGNPQLLRRAKEQLAKLTLVSRAFYSEELSLFCRDLAAFCGMELVLPMNSGAEAVETAIKLARRWGVDRKGLPPDVGEIVVFNNNFHGRTTTIISFSDSPESRRGYGPYTPGFVSCPYGDLKSLEGCISERTVAVLIEPIQGEAGILIPPDGFLTAVRKLCTERNVLLLADEIQTGFFRTGRKFACDHEGVIPDVYILGKSLGGGIVPISAIVGKKGILEVFTPGSHGSTFGGNPFACAIARETIKLMNEGDFAGRVTELGGYLQQQLISFGSGVIAKVRGRGLLIGLDISPTMGKAKKIAYELLDQRILTKDTRATTLRIAPPLTISREELDWALERFERVFKHP